MRANARIFSTERFPKKVVESGIRGGSDTILVVEDDASMRELTIAVSKSAGYKVLAARDSEEGLEIEHTTTEEIDLLLTDVIMPKMNGLNCPSR